MPPRIDVEYGLPHRGPFGIVQDQQGGAIGKADVSARNTETGAVRKTASEDNGEYRITSMGRKALENYLNHMEGIIRSTRGR